MRCATVTTIYAFTGTGTTRGTYTGLTVGATDVSSCTAAQLIVMTQQEFDQGVVSPFRLTVAEGGAVAGAILALWALAFGIRQVVRVMRETTPAPDFND